MELIPHRETMPAETDIKNLDTRPALITNDAMPSLRLAMVTLGEGKPLALTQNGKQIGLRPGDQIILLDDEERTMGTNIRAPYMTP